MLCSKLLTSLRVLWPRDICYTASCERICPVSLMPTSTAAANSAIGKLRAILRTLGNQRRVPSWRFMGFISGYSPRMVCPHGAGAAGLGAAPVATETKIDDQDRHFGWTCDFALPVSPLFFP